MVSRTKTAVDPPVPHFSVQGASAELRKDAPDYLADANLYRRQILDVDAARPGGIGTRWFVGARSGFMTGYQDGLVRVRRTAEDIAADGIDGVVVSLVVTGRFRVMTNGRDESFEAGELFVEDTLHPREAVNSFGSSGTIFIPRERFVAAVSAPTEHLSLARLPRTPLRAAVAQQILFLQQNLGELPPDEFEVLLDGAIDAALMLLRKLAAGAPGAADPILHAAKALIDAEFRDVDLTPARIARRIGCSRAVLYRSFGNAGLTVAGYLREARFRHFLEALRAGSDAPLVRLAYDSGFAANASDFTKLFKRAYGVTPSEARARLSPLG